VDHGNQITTLFVSFLLSEQCIFHFTYTKQIPMLPAFCASLRSARQGWGACCIEKTWRGALQVKGLE
jgi:hypothetical protein